MEDVRWGLLVAYWVVNFSSKTSKLAMELGGRSVNHLRGPSLSDVGKTLHHTVWSTVYRIIYVLKIFRCSSGSEAILASESGVFRASSSALPLCYHCWCCSLSKPSLLAKILMYGKNKITWPHGGRQLYMCGCQGQSNVDPRRYTVVVVLVAT